MDEAGHGTVDSDGLVSFRRLTKTFRDGEVSAVKDCNLTIFRGEFFTLLGPSGSGKSTLLRMLAGLTAPTSGEIYIEGRRVTHLPPYARELGMVFQSLALFPHMSVFDNVAFPLRLRRLSGRQVRQRVREALALVRLPDVSERGPAELSGGQRQRVALARALVYGPTLLLLDEPLGALDRKLREEMQLELVRIHHDLRVTILNVTHDQREALMLSDRIGIMHDGVLEQIGTSREVYAAPATRWAASFMGEATLLSGRHERRDGQEELVIGSGRILVGPALAKQSVGALQTAVLRREHVTIAPPDAHLERCNNVFAGTVRVRAFEGVGIYYEVDVAALAATVRVFSGGGHAAPEFEIGDTVTVGWAASDVMVIAG